MVNHFRRRATISHHRAAGGMLLEVIVALVLFVTTASVVVGGLSTSASSMERLENELRAANLAYSVLARLKMGALEQPAKPNETPEGWSWELVTSPFARPRSGGSHTFVDRVEVIVRHDATGLTYRLTEAVLSPIHWEHAPHYHANEERRRWLREELEERHEEQR